MEIGDSVDIAAPAPRPDPAAPPVPETTPPREEPQPVVDDGLGTVIDVTA